MKVLITGACGFLGRHLVDYIRSSREDIILDAADCVDADGLVVDKFFKIDLTEEQQVSVLIENTLPDCIIHLAGLFGGSTASAAYKVNVMTLLSLLEAVRQKCPSAAILTAGSAAEYGNVSIDYLPVKEQTPCNPANIYGQTKLLATQTAQYYHRVHGLSVMVFRPFQLIGRGVSPKLAPGAFAEQVRRAVKQGEKTIKVGNLKSFRDFLDARDAAEAIWSLCCKPAPGEIFNICSGRFTQMAELLELMIKVSGASVNVEIDPARLRGNEDVSIMYGSYEKIDRYCGWQPKVSLEQSIQRLFF